MILTDSPLAPVIVVLPVTVRSLLRFSRRIPFPVEFVDPRLANVKPLPRTELVVPMVFLRIMAAPPEAVIVAGLLKLIVPPLIDCIPVALVVVTASEPKFVSVAGTGETVF